MKWKTFFFLLLFIAAILYFIYDTGVWEQSFKPVIFDFLELDEQIGATFQDSVENAQRQDESALFLQDTVTELSTEEQIQENLFQQQQQEMEKLKKQLDVLTSGEIVEDETNLKKIAKIYEAMTPKEVAIISAEMNPKLFVKILANMKTRSAGKILNEITKSDPQKAVELSQLMVKLKGKKK